jgi:hypothetical protein
VVLPFGQELLVDMAVEIDAGRLLALRAAALVEHGQAARVQTIPDGTTQIHKLVTGRELLGFSPSVRTSVARRATAPGQVGREDPLVAEERRETAWCLGLLSINALLVRIDL